MGCIGVYRIGWLRFRVYALELLWQEQLLWSAYVSRMVRPWVHGREWRLDMSAALELMRVGPESWRLVASQKQAGYAWAADELLLRPGEVSRLHDMCSKLSCRLWHAMQVQLLVAEDLVLHAELRSWGCCADLLYHSSSPLSCTWSSSTSQFAGIKSSRPNHSATHARQETEISV